MLLRNGVSIVAAHHDLTALLSRLTRRRGAFHHRQRGACHIHRRRRLRHLKHIATAKLLLLLLHHLRYLAAALLHIHLLKAPHQLHIDISEPSFRYLCDVIFLDDIPAGL